jgi:signal transduction histidine kinase
VKVQLDITPDIIRFSLENNGLLKDARVDTSLNQADVLNEGMGLKSLRRRASAYGGSFSATKVTKEDQFLLIIVLPI